MTVLARPAPLTEDTQSDHNACGPIALAACLDTLGLPTDWTVLRTWMGGDAQGTFASQLVSAAHRRDPSVIAFPTVDNPAVVVQRWVPQGYYVLLAGYCYGNAEPAPPAFATAKHWYIVFGTGWECCNIWTGTYPTYPNLAASYVKSLGCVVLGRSTAPAPPQEIPMGGAFRPNTHEYHWAVVNADKSVSHWYVNDIGDLSKGGGHDDLHGVAGGPVLACVWSSDGALCVIDVVGADGAGIARIVWQGGKWGGWTPSNTTTKQFAGPKGDKGDPGTIPATATVTGTVSLK